jgi:hypothetical protein
MTLNKSMTILMESVIFKKVRKEILKLKLVILEHRIPIWLLELRLRTVPRLDQLLPVSWTLILKNQELRLEVLKVDIGLFQLRISSFKDLWIWFSNPKWRKMILKRKFWNMFSYLKQIIMTQLVTWNRFWKRKN